MPPPKCSQLETETATAPPQRQALLNSIQAGTIRSHASIILSQTYHPEASTTRFSEVLHRVTGISTPIGGVSWEPSKTELAVARRVIAFLEDRRVLYAPGELEIPHHCVMSVIEICHYFTQELGYLDGASVLGANLRAMRAACRKFLDRVGPDGSRVPRGIMGVCEALGELRGVIGVHLARVAAQFKLDIEDDLALILPARDQD